MVALVSTVAYLGLEARAVEVQCQVAPGLPSFAIVGLPDKAVAESRERVRAAIAALGLSLPPKRITINLSPADLPKEGSHYDLPIAAALLGAMGIMDAESLSRYVVVGELALDGRLAATPGALLAALHASAGDMGLICPAAQGAEAAWVGDIEVLSPPDLLALLNHFKGQAILSPPVAGEAPEPEYGPDLKQVKGQESAKRALEIAAAGGHNMLMSGPPGSGKSLMASCLPGILPALSAAEALEVSMIASVAGTLQGGEMSRTRPYRAPHHSASMAALVGGGLKVRPGEVSLAHLGVLFLDELPEFQRAVLDSLRQPLESGEISVARANAHVTFPAQVQLIAAMNPCRCGHLGDASLACSRAPKCAADYQSKISGPLLDRIDLHVEVQAVAASDLAIWPAPLSGDDAHGTDDARGVEGGGSLALERSAAQSSVPGSAAFEDSATVAARVARARAVQNERYAPYDIRINCQMEGAALDRFARPDPAGQELLVQATEAMRLTARGYTRILRVARTIADLAEQDEIGRVHIAEALSYRRQPPRN